MQLADKHAVLCSSSFFGNCLTSSVANRSALGEFANDRAGQIYGPDEQCQMVYGDVSSLMRVWPAYKSRTVKTRVWDFGLVLKPTYMYTLVCMWIQFGDYAWTSWYVAVPMHVCGSWMSSFLSLKAVLTLYFSNDMTATSQISALA